MPPNDYLIRLPQRSCGQGRTNTCFAGRTFGPVSQSGQGDVRPTANLPQSHVGNAVRAREGPQRFRPHQCVEFTAREINAHKMDPFWSYRFNGSLSSWFPNRSSAKDPDLRALGPAIWRAANCIGFLEK